MRAVARRRAAAEAGRQQALAAREREHEEATRREAKLRYETARQQAAALVERRRRAETVAAQAELRVAASPQPPASPAAEQQPQTQPTTTQRVRSRHAGSGRGAAAASAEQGSGGEAAAREAARLARVRELEQQRRERATERQLLLAEAKADRAHRRALGGRGGGSRDSGGGGAGEAGGSGNGGGRGDASGEVDAAEAAAARTRPFRKLPALPAGGGGSSESPAAARAERLTVMLPGGKAVQTCAAVGNTVADLVAWLAAECIMPTRVHDGASAASAASGAADGGGAAAGGGGGGEVEALLETHALLDGGAFPPKELRDLELSLEAAGVRGGATLVLQPRGAGPAKGDGAARRKAVDRGAARRAAAKAAGRKPTSPLALAGGRIVGTLCGAYTFEDSAFARAGMLLLCADEGSEGAELLAALQQRLNFMSFAFQMRPPPPPPDASRRWGDGYLMPSGYGGGDGDDDDARGGFGGGSGGADAAALEDGCEQLYAAVHALTTHQPSLQIRAVVGHGAAADACLRYAATYGHAASCPVRRLALLGASHSSHGGRLADAGMIERMAIAGARAQQRPSAADVPPPVGWSVLSVHGADDVEVPRACAELWHVRHRGGNGSSGSGSGGNGGSGSSGVATTPPLKLRVVAGADHAFSSAAALETLADTLNDWLEGARRLTNDDSANWQVAGAALSGAAEGTFTSLPPPPPAHEDEDLAGLF